MRVFEDTAGWLASQPDLSRFDVAFDMVLVSPATDRDTVVELDGDPDLISWVSCESLVADDETVTILFAEVPRETVLVIRARR